jgi:hypothetical protein
MRPISPSQAGGGACFISAILSIVACTFGFGNERRQLLSEGAVRATIRRIDEEDEFRVKKTFVSLVRLDIPLCGTERIIDEFLERSRKTLLKVISENVGPPVFSVSGAL